MSTPLISGIADKAKYKPSRVPTTDTNGRADGVDTEQLSEL